MAMCCKLKCEFHDLNQTDDEHNKETTPQLKQYVNICTIYVYIYIYTNTYVYIFIYIYVYLYTYFCYRIIKLDVKDRIRLAGSPFLNLVSDYRTSCSLS